MQFPIHRIDGSVLDLYPKLAEFKEFKATVKPLHKDKTIRYILYCYDIKSPLVKNNVELMKRKYEALILAGYELSASKKFSADIERMIMGENDKVNKMIVRFVRIQKNHKYSLLVATEQAYYKKINTMMDSSARLTKQEHDATRQMEMDIETLTSEIFGGDTTSHLIESLYDSILFDQVELRPEDIATKLLKDEIPVNSRPYGDKVEQHSM